MSRFSNRLLSLLLAIGLFITAVEGSPFSRIVSFGDSLADTGTAHALTGGILPQYGGYPTDRYTNGLVWVEYLAQRLDLPIDDYAVAGAFTDDRNTADFSALAPLNLPGLADQIEMFLADTAEQPVGNRDLFTVIIGANDFFGFANGNSELPYPGGVINTLAAVETLLDAGARTVVVVLVPDFTVTPAFAGLSGEDAANLKAIVSLYNADLQDGLRALEASHHATMVIVNMYALLNELVANPADYGLTNVTVPALFNLPEADTSLFWDTVHPTTYGHQLLATYVLDSMLEVLVPGQAIGVYGNIPGWAKVKN